MHHPVGSVGGTTLRWLLGTVLAAALIATAAIVVASAWHDGEPSRAQWLSAQPAAAASPTAVCPTDSSQQPPDDPPTSVVWTRPSTALPIRVPDGGQRFGPCRHTATTAAGYAHTPTGALIAATQLLVRTTIAGDVGTDTVRDQVVAGPGKQQLMAHLATASGVRQRYRQVAGYAVTDYTPDRATVLIALDPRAGSQYLVFPVTLRWNRDWRLLPPVDGDWSATAIQQSTLDPLVPWTA